MKIYLPVALLLAGCPVDEDDTGGDTSDTGADTSDTGPNASDDDGDFFTEDQGDCDDHQPAINPQASDVVGDDIDQNCDGVDGLDSDGDGHADLNSGGDDCDDHDAKTFPGAVEVWYDGKAQGCQVPPSSPWDDSDQDADGWKASIVSGEDCDDIDPNVNPVQFDLPDGIDNNCTGVVDGMRLTLSFVGDVAHATLSDMSSSEGASVITLKVYTRNQMVCRFEAGAEPSVGVCGDLVGGPETPMTSILFMGRDPYTPDPLILCTTFGTDPSALDPAGNCLREDPTTW